MPTISHPLYPPRPLSHSISRQFFSLAANNSDHDFLPYFNNYFLSGQHSDRPGEHFFSLSLGSRNHIAYACP